MSRPKVKFIHFNTIEHRKNKKDGGQRGVLAVRNSRSGPAKLYHSVEFEGKGRVVYDPEDPLPCGAVAWIEIEGDIVALPLGGIPRKEFEQNEVHDLGNVQTVSS